MTKPGKANATTYRDWLVNGMCVLHIACWDEWDTTDHPLSWRMCAVIRITCKRGQGCGGGKVYDARHDCKLSD